MKINPNFNPSAQIETYRSNAGTRCPAGSESCRQAPCSRSADSIALSDRAREILAAKKMLASVPDIRTGKVAEIKARVENNTYRFDSRKTASGMIRDSVLNAILQSGS